MWVAQVSYGGKRVFNGYFYTKEEAAAAYERAANDHFGEFARTA